MMAEQLVFDLAGRPALGRGDFFSSSSNELALRQIDGWATWAGRKLALIGPEGSGKSHLVAVWAGLCDAKIISASDQAAVTAMTGDCSGPVAVEDVDQAAGDPVLEEALFHLHNAVMGQGAYLLLTGRSPPKEWGLELPDLLSRVLAADVARLGPPDDALLSAVMVKLFVDRQLHVDPSVISYLMKRVDRSFSSVARIVAFLDEASMRSKHKITTRLAAQVLADIDSL